MLRQTYVAEQILNDIRLARHGRGFNSVLEQLVLLAESDRLLPSLVFAVDVGCDLTEEDQVVLLQTLGKINGVIVVVVVDRVAECLIVLLFDKEVVEGVVDLALVLRLDVEEEGLDQRNVVRLDEHADNTVDVDSGSQRLQEIGQESWLLLKIETQSPVVNLNVSSLGDSVLERLVLPGICGTLHHGKGGVVPLIVVDIEEDEFGPGKY